MYDRQELLREVARVAELIGKWEASNARPAVKISRARYSLDYALNSRDGGAPSAILQLREVQE